MKRNLLAAALAASTLVASVAVTPAEAQWRGGYGYHYGHRGFGPGAIVGGALLGLGVGALLAAPYVVPPPPRVVYAPPPPAYYYPPPYAYAPPAYYAPYRAY